MVSFLVGTVVPIGPEAAFAVLGLLIGSFLNVVIYRLPLMMERAFAADQAAGPDASEPAPFNLSVPRSACPRCGHQIRWFENIPLLSYLVLRGKCSRCTAPIGIRYPLVEAASGLAFAYCAWRWGMSWQALAWAGFGATLLALACIDWDTMMLPDDITLPLIWAGLVASLMGWTGTPLVHAVQGALAGYLLLWVLYQLTLRLTGKEGLGYGDFKLFAAIGAWQGWMALPMVLLIASAAGVVVGLVMKARGQLQGGALPFGPFLALGSLTVLSVGEGALARIAGFG